jgi:hypothetical protein
MSERDQKASGSTRLLRLVLLAEGGYFVATGAWANLHRGSFERIAGPKQDYWLVRVVGLLVLIVGTLLAKTATKSRPQGDLVVLGAATAIALGAVEAYFAVWRRISSVYLLDAVVEGVLVLGLAVGWRRAKLGPDHLSAGREPSPT